MLITGVVDVTRRWKFKTYSLDVETKYAEIKLN